MNITRLGSDDWEITFDDLELEDYSHQGDCHDDCLMGVEENLDAFRANFTPEEARSILKPYGGWDEDELAEMDDINLYVRILWIAAGNALDNGELTAFVSAY